MKRDAPALPIPPEQMAYYQTPATPPSTWRAELARIGLVCGAMLVAGAFVTGTSVILWRSWQTVGIGAWLTGLLIVGYLAWYAWRVHGDVRARRDLDLARMYAEHDALLTAVDTNDDGQADANEVDTFVNYVGRLHRGEVTTSAHAQSVGIAGPDWQDYRDWLIAKGYAYPVGKRGGKGFALKPSVLRTPWPKLEAQLRQRVTASLADGLTITDTRKPAPADRVSTLDD
mgnify:CR=1 FL=1